MELFRFLFRRSRGKFILAIFIGAIAGTSGAYLVALVHRGLREFPFHANLMIWSFVGALAVRFISGVVSRVLLVNLGQSAIFELRTLIPAQILAVPLRRLEQLGMNRLLANLTGDVLTIAQALVTIPTVIVGLLTTAAAFIYLGYLSWKLLIILLAILFAGLVCYRLPSRIAMRHLRLAREEADQLMQHFKGTIEGVKELKLHGERQEAFMQQNLRATADRYRRYHQNGMALLGIAGNWGQLLVFLGIGLTLFLFGEMLGVSRFVVMGYLLTVLFVAAYIEAILATLPTLGRAKVSLKKIRDLSQWLETDRNLGEIVSDTPTKPQPAFTGIALDSVSFTYAQAPDTKQGEKRRMRKRGGLLSIFKMASPKRKVRKHHISNDVLANADTHFGIGPLTLSFKPGELVFLIGGNGSGKTTLIKLLSGLYPAATGRILLNEKPVTEQNIDEYRRNFTVIYQDFYLFENLLGLDSPERDVRAQELLAELQLEDKVEVRDGRFSSTELSHGQRKRLALLTAWMEDRPFYIFDEWAADQDPAYKAIFYNKILPELKARNKAVLVISHDDQYHNVADRIIKLDYGKVEYDHPRVERDTAVP